MTAKTRYRFLGSAAGGYPLPDVGFIAKGNIYATDLFAAYGWETGPGQGGNPGDIPNGLVFGCYRLREVVLVEELGPVTDEFEWKDIGMDFDDPTEPTYFGDAFVGQILFSNHFETPSQWETRTGLHFT